MKKTLTLLLTAMASGFAVAAEPLDLNWQNNTADLTKDANGNEINFAPYTWATNTITVAANLNWQAMMQDGIEGEYTLFSIANDTKNHGLCAYFGSENYIDAWTNSEDDYNAYELPLEESWNNATKAAIVYCAYISGKSSFTTFNVYLYLWDENDNMSCVTTTADYAHGVTLNSISTISFNSDLVNKVQVYNDLFSSNETPELAKAVVSTTIPEPTTATLSLLALAGLAARRRRR